jgi:hypothetical protein
MPGSGEITKWAQGHSDQQFSREGFRNGACLRCGGLMVKESCMDLLNRFGDVENIASRCVQCGEVLDPVILLNRIRQREATGAGRNLAMPMAAVGCGFDA